MLWPRADLDTALVGLGRDPRSLEARARTAEGKDARRQQTDIANSLKIFGVPSFVVDGELFRGDDRLEEAIDWAAWA